MTRLPLELHPGDEPCWVSEARRGAKAGLLAQRQAITCWLCLGTFQDGFAPFADVPPRDGKQGRSTPVGREWFFGNDGNFEKGAVAAIIEPAWNIHASAS